jgi:Protein of unknown function (DUF3800)
VKYLFLDESGDHSLTRIDPQYPVFVLGGVVVDADYAVGDLTRRVTQFKLDTLGRTDVTLHTADIVRARGDFTILKDPERRRQFYASLNQVMRELGYTVVACAIRKDSHLAAYGAAALDPYMLSLSVLVERFCFEIADSGALSGHIIAEKRDRTLDAALRLAWTAMGVNGTTYLPPAVIKERIGGLHLRDKKSKIAGLELADLVVSPIGRFVAGLAPREDFAIIQEKFRRRAGVYLGPGLVVLPKE